MKSTHIITPETVREIYTRPLEPQDSAELLDLSLRNSTRLETNFPGLKIDSFSQPKLAKSLEQKGNSKYYGIIIGEPGGTGALIGLIGFYANQRRNPKFFLEYWIDGKNEGQGHTTQALGQLLKSEAGPICKPLYAHVQRQNVASRRVLEKSGFSLLRGRRILTYQHIDSN